MTGQTVIKYTGTFVGSTPDEAKTKAQREMLTLEMILTKQSIMVRRGFQHKDTGLFVDNLLKTDDPDDFETAYEATAYAEGW